MSIQKQVIKIYIHPDNDVIKQMDLDITAVREAAYRAPGYDQDKAALQEIGNQIKKRFPHVDTSSNPRQLAALLGRLSMADAFNGVVIRLQGKIDDCSSAPPRTIQSELDAAVETISQMRSKLEKERKDLEALKVRTYALENENRRLKVFYDKEHNELITLRPHIEQLKTEAARARRGAEHAQENVDQLTKKVASLQTHLDLAQQELQERPAQTHSNEQELAALRKEKRDASAREAHLNNTIERLEGEINRLQGIIRSLTEDLPEEYRTSAGDNYDL